MKNIKAFPFYSLKEMARGGRAYYAWRAFLGVPIWIGAAGVGTLRFTLFSKPAIPLTFSEPLERDDQLRAEGSSKVTYRSEPQLP